MKIGYVAGSLCFGFFLTLLAARGDGAGLLDSNNLNLIFVASPDLAYCAPGDLDTNTANLTCQGLQRALQMGTYLKQQVLGTNNNVDGIYALSPTTHPQTAQGYPDMAALGYVEHFALLNRYTQPSNTNITANSSPLHAAYAPGNVPYGVAVPKQFCEPTGLAFNDVTGQNVALVNKLIATNQHGYHVFSAPWETIKRLVTDVDAVNHYKLPLPLSYATSNTICALAIAANGKATLHSLGIQLHPSTNYPAVQVPAIPPGHPQQAYYCTVRMNSVDGVTVPRDINTNQKMYIIRHAEAHPDGFEDGNLVGAGEWRALALPDALRGKINPTVVYSIDPAQWLNLPHDPCSYVRPSLTVWPYVIANNLPFHLVASFELGPVGLLDFQGARKACDYFFTGGTFSGQTVLLAWESQHIKPLINELLKRYGGHNLPHPPIVWPGNDYDTIWTIKLDAQGNLTVDNELCEGIDSAKLPQAAPGFPLSAP